MKMDLRYWKRRDVSPHTWLGEKQKDRHMLPWWEIEITVSAGAEAGEMFSRCHAVMGEREGWAVEMDGAVVKVHGWAMCDSDTGINAKIMGEGAMRTVGMLQHSEPVGSRGSVGFIALLERIRGGK